MKMLRINMGKSGFSYNIIRLRNIIFCFRIKIMVLDILLCCF